MNSTSTSPSKGKPKEPTQWRTGWWDYFPLQERPKGPIEWTPSSVIFTAHPTQPVLNARHFSSSKQFVVRPPKTVIPPTEFEPPSIITVAPGETWLFAYFPKLSGDGMGCLWKRGPQIDSWTFLEYWSYAPEAGVVVATWLGKPREWVSDTEGNFSRLPARGPSTPVSNPTLLIITQNHQAHVCYMRHYVPTLKIIRSSLRSSRTVSELSPQNLDEPINERRKLCVDAAIGVGYNETSIIIAMHSRNIPLLPKNIFSFDPLDLDASVEIDKASSDPMFPEWEAWEDEFVTYLSEIQLNFDGSQMSLSVYPLPPIRHMGAFVSGLKFICKPPPTLTLAETKRSPTLRNKVTSESGKMFLVAVCLDFGEYTSTPRSEIIAFSIQRHTKLVAPHISRHTWAIHREASRSFSPGILTLVEPLTWNVNETVLFAGVLDTSGSLVNRKEKDQEVPIGLVRVLKIPDLSDDLTWDDSVIKISAGKVGRELPLYSVMSPNNLLLCTSSMLSWPVQTIVHTLPRPPRSRMDSKGASILTLSISLAIAIIGRKATTDITHILALTSTPLEEAIDIVYQTLVLIDRHDKELAHQSTWDVLGTIIEIYRARAASQKNELNSLTARWQSAHDMCSLAACNIVFEDSREGDTYDLDAVWQLIGLFTWVVGFAERLMKECVFCSSVIRQGTEGLNGPIQGSPTLLHLVHPFALENLKTGLQHVRQFRTYLGSLPAGGENAHIAREVLVDLVDCSGIDITALCAVLEDIIKESYTFDPEECRKALASCRPTATMLPRLQEIIHKITRSSILNKSTLFLKPFDLMAGVARLSISSPKKDERDHDVISKGTLPETGPYQTCLRCGGKSESGIGLLSNTRPQISIRWHTWEKRWTLRCICRGPWLSATFHRT